MSWRLFVSLPVPAAVRAPVAEALAPLRLATRAHLRWVPAETWHVTLAFLGDVPAERVDVVAGAVAAGVESWAVAGRGAVGASLAGASRFGRGLLFLAVDDEAFATVRDLGAMVRGALAAAGVEHDDKPLHPHVTLARQRDRRGRGVSRTTLDEVRAALDAVAPEARRWQADHVAVVRSHLGDGPVRHEPVARVALAG